MSAQYENAKSNSKVAVQLTTLEAGKLGAFFGMGTNAATNITGVTIALLMIFAIALFFLQPVDKAIEVLKLLLPVLTGALGYLFGKGQN